LKTNTLVRPHGARRLRASIGGLLLLAIAWPSLGPLPYLVHDFAPHVAAAATHGSDAPDHHDDRAVDASAIPGSPTHPVDHDCAECEVLKHLSRCVLPILAVAVPAPVLVAVPAPRVAVVAHARVNARFILPPVRAPPRAPSSQTLV
jgi:hypothetical protein